MASVRVQMKFCPECQDEPGCFLEVQEFRQNGNGGPLKLMISSFNLLCDCLFAGTESCYKAGGVAPDEAIPVAWCRVCARVLNSA